jgi:surface antigen
MAACARDCACPDFDSRPSIRHEERITINWRKQEFSTMRAKATLAMSLLGATLGLVACNSTPQPPAAAVAPVVSAPPPPAPGVIGGAIGQSLDEKDRAAAIAAQQEAVASGARKSWRGARGAYGFITPGAENGACRDYTHKIFIDGRPREAKGQACRENGEWRVTG